MNPEISRLFFYPIKSFRGVEVKALPLDRQGAVWDRQWMLVDEKNSFLTQRQMPQLAKFGLTFVEDSHIEIALNGALVADFGLLEKEAAELTVRVWKDDVPAHEVSRDVSSDLSTALGKEVRLVRLSESCDRPGRFSDDAPLLVLSEASLKGLEERAKVSLSIARFRPNIVLRSCSPHAEDEWSAFKIGETTFRKKKPCTRCRITQVHPLSGEVGEEPLKTLMTYRKIEKGIAFGHYYMNDQISEIQVGQSLTIL